MVKVVTRDTRPLGKLTMALGAIMCSLMAPAVFGATVAVIDTGLDIEQPELAGKIWLNPIDSTVNGIDEDHNGYVDDIHGWNFLEQSHELLDVKSAKYFNPDTVKFFSILNRYYTGDAVSRDDLLWVRQRQDDPTFMAQINGFFNYAHGTHVAGIAARQGPGVQIIGVSRTRGDHPFIGRTEPLSAVCQSRDTGYSDDIGNFREILDQIADQQMEAYRTLGDYVASVKADVVNFSAGLGADATDALIAPMLQEYFGGKCPSQAQLRAATTYLLREMVRRDAVFVTAAPKTLFVFAAGNSGTDNDTSDFVPANIKHSHVISVAAVFQDGRPLAASNYGPKSVDMAAPGVSIESTLPGNHRMAFSGTSQAAPAVAGTAAAMKAINPALTADDLRQILLGTVDVLPALKDKVRSGGVLNNARARAAATLSLGMTVSEAIAGARRSGVPGDLSSNDQG